MGMIILIALLATIYWLFKRFIQNDNLLEDQGIAHEKPSPLVGSILPLLLQKEGGDDFVQRHYEMFPNEK